MQLNSFAGTLTPRAPFDFTHSLRFLGEFAPTRGEQSLAGQTLTKAVMVASQPWIFEIRSTGAFEIPSLAYRAWTARPVSDELRRALEDRLRFYLSLDDDLRPFYALAETDPAFAPVVKKLYGLHQVKFLTPFELACWAVLVQRTPMPVSAKMKRALLEKYGASLTVNGETHLAFPEAHTLAAISETELADVLGHARKAQYLYAVTQAFAGVEESWLRTAPVEAVRDWLLAIKGIGAFSASFMLIRGLGRMELLSSIEEPLKRAVAKHYGHLAVEAVAERYGDYRGYWAHYLRVGG